MTARIAGCWCVVAGVLAVASPAGAALTEAPRLAAVYDAILDARFERADDLLKEACPPAPAGACHALGVVSLWWQIAVIPENRALDKRFTALADAAIAANEAWTRREPQSAEAWFYLAGAYAPRVQWKILRGERVGAARDGNRIREALERALARDPTLHDAYFGIGLYHYYADVAPAAARMLRWLLLLPGGDRVQGLREMLQARDRGELLKGEADYQLHFVYVWYEQKSADAIALLEGLDARYPNNPLFLQRIAEIRGGTLRDHAASAATWSALLARAEAKRVFASAAIVIRARAGVERETRAAIARGSGR